jgi:hypothetical protein
VRWRGNLNRPTLESREIAFRSDFGRKRQLATPVRSGANRLAHVVAIYEWYGYRVDDKSPIASQAALQKICPIVGGSCTKPSGICSVEATSGEAVITCPTRLYFDDYTFLSMIASDAFDDLTVDRGPTNWPTLVPGEDAKAVAAANGVAQVGVLGQGWGGEIKLPPAYPPDGPRYRIDFILIVVSATGELIRFAPIEVQSVDTTGSEHLAACANRLRSSRSSQNEARGAGFNWENVNKRIISQVIFKGLMLQGESLCRSGIYFVTIEPVFRKLMLRMGGERRFRKIPKQPGSMTFVRYSYDSGAPLVDGQIAPLKPLSDPVISTTDFSLAFITPENLPAIDSYATAIANKLGL